VVKKRRRKPARYLPYFYSNWVSMKL